MIRVAFYHPDKNFPDVDCMHLEKGNPGIGGSEYAAICVAEKLAQISTKLDVCLVTQSSNKLLPVSDGKLKRYIAGTPKQLLEVICEASIDYIIIRYGVIDINNEFYADIRNTKCKIILWCQNFVDWRNLDKLSKMDTVVRLVCVGKEQLELYLDHEAYKKSDYIFNFLPQELIEASKHRICPNEERGNDVVYMGSLVPAKTFHALAKAWPNVISKVPNAKLHVIGSGQLYDRTQKLGKYGIAEESYESLFMPYLTDRDGKILESVYFYGNMGTEKVDVISKAKVAVPNPIGLSETFCICGIEMQLCGCLLTASEYAAYLDTFNPKYSILSKDTDSLAENIILLFNRKHTVEDINKQIDWVEKKFSLDKIVKEWEVLLTESIPNNKKLHDEPIKNITFKKKWLKIMLRRLKDIFPPFRYIPSIITFNRILNTYH